MKSVTFSKKKYIYYTYTPNQYNRYNADLPSCRLKFYAEIFGGEYQDKLNQLYKDLNFFKQNEMLISPKSFPNTLFH
jgi:hypothetical protein